MYISATNSDTALKASAAATESDSNAVACPQCHYGTVSNLFGAIHNDTEVSSLKFWKYFNCRFPIYCKQLSCTLADHMRVIIVEV
jgi:hypothetical protein